MKSNQHNLTEGSIFQKLLIVALPIIGTQIIQMTYNLTDMFWLGRVGSDAVAASGTVGMYLWLSMAFHTFGSRGAEIGVAQCLGRGDKEAARKYAQSAVMLAVVLGAAYMLVMMLFRRPLLVFFSIQEAHVVADAQTYMLIVSTGIPFTFVSGTIGGIFVASGNAKTPFYANGISLIVNIILDPVLIFTCQLGIAGAAIATVCAQILACVLLMIPLHLNRANYFSIKLFGAPSLRHIKQLVKWTFPIAIETFLFCFFSMLISRFIAAFGAGAIAAQKIGTQVESLSWLISGGFSSALTAFMGQNYGAGKWRRIHKGFNVSLFAMFGWGVTVTFVLYFCAVPLFTVFLPGEPDVIQIGANNLRILALCQLPTCLEGISAGAFRGMGNTAPPSIASICVNAARVLAAYLLAQTALGLDGIWWAISIGGGLRGLWTFVWYVLAARRQPKEDILPAERSIATT